MSARTKGGMGAVAPMVTRRTPKGWARRGARPWPVTGGPARPGQQTAAAALTGARKGHGGGVWNA